MDKSDWKDSVLHSEPFILDIRYRTYVDFHSFEMLEHCDLWFVWWNVSIEFLLVVVPTRDKMKMIFPGRQVFQQILNTYHLTE